MPDHPLKTSRELSPRDLLILALSACEAQNRELANITWRADEMESASYRAGVYGRMTHLAKTDAWDDFLRIIKGQDPAIPPPPVELLDRE